MTLSYELSWPLDLFLVPSDLQTYSSLFAYLSSIRHTHARVLACWTSLSNSQRARRRWTGLGEGGTIEDGGGRRDLLRCGWGVVREMVWFLDSLWAHIMMDVVDVQFRKLRDQLKPPPSQGLREKRRGSVGAPSESGRPPSAASTAQPSIRAPLPPPSTRFQTQSGSGHQSSQQPTAPLDFLTLRTLHSVYLNNLVAGSLLSNAGCATTVRGILEICDVFVAQIERWGGDVLPALLFEGSIADEGDGVGDMVRSRSKAVREINEVRLLLIQFASRTENHLEIDIERTP